MKIILRLVIALLLTIAVRSSAQGILLTNAIPQATYAAGTNFSGGYSANATFQPPTQTVFINHAVINTNFPTTAYLRVTFDGGLTWANITNWVPSNTNSVAESFVPQFNSPINATFSFQLITTSNLNIGIQPAWNQ
jgi:hypothetical protein